MYFPWQTPDFLFMLQQLKKKEQTGECIFFGGAFEQVQIITQQLCWHKVHTQPAQQAVCTCVGIKYIHNQHSRLCAHE